VCCDREQHCGHVPSVPSRCAQEWAIYWIHRYLHDNQTLYLLLHKTHHIYNNRGSLSPFAGLAFDPVDGLMQVRCVLRGSTAHESRGLRHAASDWCL